MLRVGDLKRQCSFSNKWNKEWVLTNSLLFRWLTCVGLGALEKFSSRCHSEMLSLGPPWYWDVWNVDKGRRHWNYSNKGNSEVGS
jgi:hypothetical protein